VSAGVGYNDGMKKHGIIREQDINPEAPNKQIKYYKRRSYVFCAKN
jgi:hypothetical protein